MTKIKLALLAVLLAISATTNLPAPPPVGGCFYATMGWSCSVSQPQAGVWLFSLAVGSAYDHADVYLNGSLYGATPYRSFYWPATLHGAVTVKGRTASGCVAELGTFVL
jgi:hypothetical protein